MQEPAQPHALAAAVFADAVHAVVPVAGADERQAVLAHVQRAFEPEAAVLEQRRGVVADCRLEKCIVTLARQRRSFDERHLHVEDGAIAGERDVVRGDERQPHAIVGDVRAHALAVVRQPPVLHVAFGELARGGAQDLLAQQRGPREAQRHRILQLVAETVGAARLVEAGARPGAAGQRLIQQPAIHHDVERAVGRLDLHVAGELVPVRAHLREDAYRDRRLR